MAKIVMILKRRMRPPDYGFGEWTLTEEPLMQKVIVTKLSVQKWTQETAMSVSKKEISPCPIDAMLSVIDGAGRGRSCGGCWMAPCGPTSCTVAFRRSPSAC
jgi:hypothetical protein